MTHNKLTKRQLLIELEAAREKIKGLECRVEILRETRDSLAEALLIVNGLK